MWGPEVVGLVAASPLTLWLVLLVSSLVWHSGSNRPDALVTGCIGWHIQCAGALQRAAGPLPCTCPLWVNPRGHAFLCRPLSRLHCVTAFNHCLDWQGWPFSSLFVRF